MIPVAPSPALASPLRFLATDGGAHPAAKWAQVTTLDLIAIDQAMPPARLEAAIALRKAVQRVLLDVFELVKATSTGEQINTLATQAMVKIVDRARGTDWYGAFAHPDTNAVMHVLIRRNLATAADIAIAWD